VTKVYEFGNGKVREHLCGIYDYLQERNIESLAELQKGSGEKTANTTNNEENHVSESKLSYEAQKEFNRNKKKLEKQIKDCEKEISQLDAAIKILEEKMATVEGATDITLYEKHGNLKKQLEESMEEWETVSNKLDELENNNK
jgi:hypothetical protein